MSAPSWGPLESVSAKKIICSWKRPDSGQVLLSGSSSPGQGAWSLPAPSSPLSSSIPPTVMVSRTALEGRVRVLLHRITESQKGGGGRDICGSPSPTPCQSRVTQSRLHRTLSRRGWNISREGDSTTSLGSLFQCSVTLRVKFFLMFRQNMCVGWVKLVGNSMASAVLSL